jgi:hypothetical protein
MNTKLLQYTSETYETLKIYTYNKHNVILLLGRIELVIVELDTGAELDATECTDVDEM